jgi:hypothetical protein
MNHPRVMGKRPFLPKSYMGPIRFQLHTGSVLLATAAGKFSINLPAYNPAAHLPTDRIRLVWKSVSGIGRLPALLHALPKARAVIILRHPGGFVASQIRGLKSRVFGDAPQFSQEKKPLHERIRAEAQRRYGLTDAEVSNMTVEERFTWRWVIDHELTLERLKDIERCSSVWYEDLCNDPSSAYKALFERTDLSWGEITEGFLAATTQQQDDSYYSVYKNPEVAANRWRDELSEDAVRRITDIVHRAPVHLQPK